MTYFKKLKFLLIFKIKKINSKIKKFVDYLKIILILSIENK